MYINRKIILHMKKPGLFLIAAALWLAGANTPARNLCTPAKKGTILEYVSTDGDNNFEH